MKNRTGELGEVIADIRYRNDYCGKELKKLIDLPPYLRNIYLAEADQILKACKDKGLAFVVDRELPEYPCSWRISGYAGEVQQDMLKAGYKPFEEIEIEENTTKKNTDQEETVQAKTA